MKKNLIKILFLIIILMMTLMACAPNNNAYEIQTGESRFVIIERKFGEYTIAYDRYTKVMYIISQCSGTFTLLVDADGNPLLYEN